MNISFCKLLLNISPDELKSLEEKFEQAKPKGVDLPLVCIL
jgi:hypothetical protein